VAAAVCLRTIRFVPGQGMLQTLAALVLLGAVAVGADTWGGTFGIVARAQVERATALEPLALPEGDPPGR
ncbi:MAG: hypothetical protein ACKOC4_13250, partial [Planctomycetia bacterium]